MKANLDDGFAKISNKIIDKLCSTRLGGYESMVLWCVFRKTYGWNKKEDWIAGTQIEEMTGIKLSHVSRTIKSLKQMNIVTKNGNKLRINTDTSSWLPKLVTKKKLPKMVSIVTKNGNDVTKNGNKRLPKMGYTKDNKDINTKDTIQKTTNSLQKYIDSFNVLFKREFRISKGRGNKLKARLKVFSLKEVLTALENLSKSPWHRGINKSGWTASPDFLIRSDEKFDEWLNKDMKQAKQLSSIINKKDRDEKSKIRYI